MKGLLNKKAWNLVESDWLAVDVTKSTKDGTFKTDKTALWTHYKEFAKKEGWGSADKISQAVSYMPEVEEKKIFGSLVFMVGGNCAWQQVLIGECVELIRSKTGTPYCYVCSASSLISF